MARIGNLRILDNELSFAAILDHLDPLVRLDLDVVLEPLDLSAGIVQLACQSDRVSLYQLLTLQHLSELVRVFFKGAINK